MKTRGLGPGGPGLLSMHPSDQRVLEQWLSLGQNGKDGKRMASQGS